MVTASEMKAARVKDPGAAAAVTSPHLAFITGEMIRVRSSVGDQRITSIRLGSPTPIGARRHHPESLRKDSTCVESIGLRLISGSAVRAAVRVIVPEGRGRLNKPVRRPPSPTAQDGLFSPPYLAAERRDLLCQGLFRPFPVQHRDKFHRD